MPLTPTFKPTLILHGGAGAIHRSTLPPALWTKYQTSLLSYLRSTKKLLDNGATALDAAVHAVSLMEDDELFNCGRGSVFTTAGTIEMEASVMATSVMSPSDEFENNGNMKRGAGVICVRNVRHPIQLAKEVLLRTGQDEDGNLLDDGADSGGCMHSQLAGPYVEDLARSWGLEFKPDEWFWTEKRWEEHRRGLVGRNDQVKGLELVPFSGLDSDVDIQRDIPSQGTVGCVCLDQWGALAVATSTGGLTNKFPGRVGDTPTLGAGFWAESWDVDVDADEKVPSMHRSGSDGMRYVPQNGQESVSRAGAKSIWDMTLADCLSGSLRLFRDDSDPYSYSGRNALPLLLHSYDINHSFSDQKPKPSRSRKSRRAVAVSGTGNGDSFLRTAAARTACAMMRFSSQDIGLSNAVTAVAGADGELQRSAGRRWGKTSEGQGGLIGIEADTKVYEDNAALAEGLGRGKVVFDFNCGGMFRAWVEEGSDGAVIERVMVFKEPYT
ncbi:nucleophile aminohydrolase [Aspergillus californicus]